MEKFSSRCADYGIAFVTPFQLFEKHLALVSYYIAKREDFPKIVQLNRKCVNSFDADCTYRSCCTLAELNQNNCNM